MTEIMDLMKERRFYKNCNENKQTQYIRSKIREVKEVSIQEKSREIERFQLKHDKFSSIKN